MTSTPTDAGPELAPAGDVAAGIPPAPGSGPGSFLFSTREATLRTAGVRARVPATAPGAVGAAAAATLAADRDAGNPDPLVVGAVGFAPGLARLVVPAHVHRTPTLSRSAEDAPPAPPLTAPPSAPASIGTRWDFRAEPPPPRYAAAVRRALEMIAEGRLEKVVLARAATLTAPEPLDVAAVLERLAARNPAGYAFAVDVADPDEADEADARTLLGASPELLVSRRGAAVLSQPLAGTAPRSPDPDEDARRGETLAASAKDRREHALVVERVAERLAPFCTSLDVPEAPSLTHTPALWHLATRIEGRLRDPAPTSLELAEALHPTPAVCGEPTRAAREAIAELEEFPRGFYAGLVGWCDADGDGEWALAIRCAEVSGRAARVYAGAGVVEGSRPEAELAETGAKFRTLLAALGLEATP
ncbi:isochorismate synthase [Actinomycetospora cinnamomea]|uniref:isochorismate synthase n=1 Tax=Actinomycetospora cinnamomea TaxID=663609 RepID=A0A2U1FRB1_9PSEU|nr:isochorismate synthase [Actinomycetospora cinnamomea]PVZ14662.1 isochorismate synthase [Actinomycetospora cinnamomea]